MTVGTKFRGLINNEVFEITGITEKDNKIYYKIKCIKSGKVFNHSKHFVDHLQIEIYD